jgi:hypothetical protein
MVLVSELLTLVRDTLDESSASQWTDAMLVRWLNEAGRDLARSTRHLKGNETVVIADGTSEYPLGAHVIAVEHAYYLPGGGDDRSIPLNPRHYEGMDQVWGQWQNQESTYPQWYTVVGMSPAAILKLYPVPSAAANVTLLVSKLPTAMADNPVVPGATADVPALWYDALADYCEYKALRRDRDQRWQEAFELYGQKRDALIHNVDFLAQNREVVPTPTAGYMDAWLVEQDYY